MIKMKYKREFSGYLGFDPISLFVELDEVYNTGFLPNFYKEIKSFETKDIIFEGWILKNIEFLSWLTPKLINEEHYISIVFNLKELFDSGLQEVTAQRVIVIIHNLFKGWSGVLETLGENDLILVKTENHNTLSFIVDKMKNVECSASLHFDYNLLDKSKVLQQKIITAYPYGG